METDERGSRLEESSCLLAFLMLREFLPVCEASFGIAWLQGKLNRDWLTMERRLMIDDTWTSKLKTWIPEYEIGDFFFFFNQVAREGKNR